MRRGAAILVAASTFGAARPSVAESPPDDAISYRAHVDVISRLFRRQTFPSTSGALVAGDMAVPLYQYALLRVGDVDLPWREDSVDVELAAWGNLELADPGSGRVDGDIHVASARHRFRHGYVRLGRQIRTGGATRYVHFDGASAGAHTSFPGSGMRTQMGIDAYGGFTVLPRWNAQPGYHQLGSATDSLLRDQDALAAPARHEAWLTGGRAYVTSPSKVTAGLSFHEQQTAGGLERRNAAADFIVTPLDEMSWSAQAILDVDADQLADVRAGVDVYPMEGLSLRAGYQHLSPALLLSRQSVLSVFSTEAFDEWGGEANYKPWEWMRVGGFGYAVRFDDGALGARGGASLRFIRTGAVPFTVSGSYRRITEPVNGYHGLRIALTVSPVDDLRLVADSFFYIYDDAIDGYSTSLVGVASAAHRINRYVEVMLASSVARTPVSRIDAQGTARVSVTYEGGDR